MKKRDLQNLGLYGEAVIKEAIPLSSISKKNKIKKNELKKYFTEIAKTPENYLNHPIFSDLAKLTIAGESVPNYEFQEISYQSWGDDIEPQAREQMDVACKLPVAVGGALMADAHLGYGLPIGGVLATDNSVIPYAVGVDIACRVKLTIYDISGDRVERNIQPYSQAIEKNTRFGIGAQFKRPKSHPVLDQDWGFSKYVSSLHDKAWRQLGSSGSGNHFVEFGVIDLLSDFQGVPKGSYLALVSHSGSRGTGAMMANHFSKVAAMKHPKLPRKMRNLSWLSLDEEEGQEYWQAMSLMGDYASANHYLIHRDISKEIGGEILAQIENHHNFAWKEEHFGKELIVHRKGATPAAKGELGYIPGTMTAPGFLVSGKGDARALCSSSHGAGRVMSRKAARHKITANGLRKVTQESGVTLLDAGLDEAPLAYKDIFTVMEAQRDLVDVIGRFQPKIVKMAPDGEKAED